MTDRGCVLGLIGLGVMGRNYLMNVAGRGVAVAGYDLDAEKCLKMSREKTDDHDIRTSENLGEFIGFLSRPRAIMLLVPAGNPVDSVVDELVPHLAKGDLIIDSGNSHFKDTDRRAQKLAKAGLLFMGMGMSGGEAGARHGPSIMPGGAPEGFARVATLLSESAAQVGGDPCVAYLGPRSAGHYVKMVHNGIEYGIMELIAEAYDIMKRGLGLKPPDLHDVFNRWNDTRLESYLIQITADIFAEIDDKTGRPLIDLILDAARQKGTGKWTSWDAMDLKVPTPTIDAAVMMRNLSGLNRERRQAADRFEGLRPSSSAGGDRLIAQLEQALYCSVILTYGQGFALLRAASSAYEYALDPATVARIWRGGCIIRAAVLEDIRSAFGSQPDLANLLMDPGLAEELLQRQQALRATVAFGAEAGLPLPALAASLAYFDAYRSRRLPANLIQAQRDYFGSHRYERIDEDGTFHAQWQK